MASVAHRPVSQLRRRPGRPSTAVIVRPRPCPCTLCRWRSHQPATPPNASSACRAAPAFPSGLSAFQRRPGLVAAARHANACLPHRHNHHRSIQADLDVRLRSMDVYSTRPMCGLGTVHTASHQQQAACWRPAPDRRRAAQPGRPPATWVGDGRRAPAVLIAVNAVVRRLLSPGRPAAAVYARLCVVYMY